MQPIHSIQVLRALAAFMVAIHHVQPDAAILAARAGLSFTRSDILPWMAGVDIFFVVSGFIMVHASQDLFGREGASRLFLKRRLARIVPLYWAMTTLLLLVGLMVPAVLNSGAPNLRQILGSYLFWPVVSTQGMVQPVYSLGWTLNYEMLFYVLFAAGLMLPRRWILPAVAFVLALLVAAESLKGPLLLPFGFWGQPIVLEFAAGMGIAVLRQKGLRLHGALRIAVAMVGAALLVAAAHFPGADGAWSSVLWRGSAAALLDAGGRLRARGHHAFAASEGLGRCRRRLLCTLSRPSLRDPGDARGHAAARFVFARALYRVGACRLGGCGAAALSLLREAGDAAGQALARELRFSSASCL